MYLAGPDDPATLDGQAFAFTLVAADIAPVTTDPEADRQATLLTIATRAFASFGTLSTDTQAAILADLNTRLPATLADGQVVSLLGTVVGHDLALQGSDIMTTAGVLDRAATARALATRAYPGFATLTADAQQRVVDYLATRLPAQDTDVVPGAVITLPGYLTVLEVTAVQNLQFTQEDHYRQIGDGTALGSVQTHAVREGDTLKGIAAAYYGSGAYWYLIADANRLTANDPLKEGTTLTIPNASAASLNPHDAFAVYNWSKLTQATTSSPLDLWPGVSDARPINPKCRP